MEEQYKPLERARINSLIGNSFVLAVMRRLLETPGDELASGISMAESMRIHLHNMDASATDTEVEEAIWRTTELAIDKYGMRNSLGEA